VSDPLGIGPGGDTIFHYRHPPHVGDFPSFGVRDSCSVGEKPDEGFLRQVFRFFRIPDDPARESIGARAVSADERLESPPALGLTALYPVGFRRVHYL